MSSAIRQDGTDRRSTERRQVDDRRSGVVRAAHETGSDRRVVEQRGVGAAMVDALEDILRWERTSERAIHVATDASSRDVASVS